MATSLRLLAIALTAGAIMLRSPETRAQANYRNAPIGGRSQLLGGAAVVYGRDASSAFINPATAVLADDDRLSFSVNFYTISYLYAPRWFRPGPVDRTKFPGVDIENPPITALDFSSLPSSLCIFFRAGRVPFLALAKSDPRISEARIGYCLATVENQDFNFSADGFNEVHAGGVTRQAQSLVQAYRRFATGPTYAMRVSRSLAIGASFHGSLATHKSILAASTTTYESPTDAINSSFYSAAHGTSFQLEGHLGATLRFGRQTVGLAVKSPSIHVYGVGSANRQYHYDGAGSETSLTVSDGAFVSRSPMRIAIGTGISGDWGQFEFNAFYSTPLGEAYSADLRGRQVTTQGGTLSDREVSLILNEPSRGVVNFAAGLEGYVSTRVSLLGGLSTDFSAVPQGALRGDLLNYFPARQNRTAGSFGVSSHGEGGELLLGGEFSVGWGERLAVNSYQLPPTVGTTGSGLYQLMFIIAGSTSFRAIKRTFEDVKSIIVDPKGTPQKPGPARPESQTPAKQ